MKRQASSSSISPRKKRSRAERDDDLGSIISRVDSNLESIALLLQQPGYRTLNLNEKKILEEWKKKVVELLSL